MPSNGMKQLLVESAKNNNSQFKSNDFVQTKNTGSGDANLINDILADEKKRGYDQGYQDATKTVHAEWQSKLELINNFLTTIDQSLIDIDEEIHQKLLEICIGISEQVIRRELTTDSSQISLILKQIIEAIPKDDQKIFIHINPNDDQHVKEIISSSSSSDRYQIQHDPTIIIGGCKVNTDYSFIDMTIENQLASIASESLGEE